MFLLSLCCSLLSLPSTATAADLLDKSGKKSQLKQGAAWRIGPVKNLEAYHTDLGALKMQIQVDKEQCAGSNVSVLFSSI